MNRRAIMLLNHALYKTGRYTQSESLKIAWQIAKNPLRLNVAGVLFQDRQLQLRNLARVPRQHIRLSFQREPRNPYDRNAIQIIAQAQGQRPVCIGYLPKEWSAVFAPLIDRGIEIPIAFESIVGGRQLGNYGAQSKFRWHRKGIDWNATARTQYRREMAIGRIEPKTGRRRCEGEYRV